MTTDSSTPSVSVRAPEPDDALALHQLFNDAEVMRYIGDGSIRDLDYYKEFVAAEWFSFDQHGYGLGTVVADGEVAGFAGLHTWIPEWGPTGELEIGWRLGKDFWGRNIAFTAASSVLSAHPHAALMAMIDESNYRSQKLAARLGFEAAEKYTSPGGIHAICFRPAS